MRQWTKSNDFKNNYAVKAVKMSDEELANLCITLCHQTIYMLIQLLKTLQERFVTQGGIKERMHNARTGYREEQTQELNTLRQENIELRQQIAQLEEYIRTLNLKQ